MFERILYTLIQERIDELSADDKKLRRLLALPGRSRAEQDKLVAYWAGDGKPRIEHGFPRVGSSMPLISITLASEGPEQFYIGDGAGFLTVSSALKEEAAALVAQLEEEHGGPVECSVQRWTYSYGLYVYAQTPDVCLAYYNVLKAAVVRATKRLIMEGAENPTYNGMDLAPDPRFAAENVFTRVFNVTLKAHVLVSDSIILGPLASGRGTKVARIHVADHVTDVNPGVTPYSVDDEA